MRHSLEVPADSGPSAALAEPSNGNTSSFAPLTNITNGSADHTPASMTSATYMPGMDDSIEAISVEKRNSLGRAGAKIAGRRPVGLARMSQDHLPSSRDSAGSLGGHHDHGRVGVSLEDKPMED